MAGGEGRFYQRAKVPIWILVWLLTRALIVAQVNFWHPGGAEYQDVNVYEMWSNGIVSTHTLPVENTWQYPPGAAFLMLIPRIGGGSFGTEFVVLMLLFDLVGFWLMSRFAKEEHRDTGVWIWLLAMPMLFSLPVLRFDLAPTVVAMGALLVIHRRPAWFGALAGLGGMLKVWPLFVLFGEWDRRLLLRSVAAALVVIVAIFAVSEIAFSGSFRFLTNQGDRGLQVESIAATPWYVRQVVTGKELPVAQRYGTNEIASSTGDAIGKALDLVALGVFAGAAYWWWLRNREIGRGRRDLTDVALSRDFVFTVVLLFIVVSRVLSPQYLIWMVGLCAIVLTSRRTRVGRPAWIVLGAIVLTAGLYQSPANFVIRNTALLVAAIDASVAMAWAVRRPMVRDEEPDLLGDAVGPGERLQPVD
jgi:Glycosyltransferase family 87